MFCFNRHRELNQSILTSFTKLAEQHGIDTYLHFIRRIIGYSHARLLPTLTPAAFDESTSLTFRLLVQETQRLARDPFLADRFREGVGGAEGETFRQFDFARFLDRVCLHALERLVLAAAIVAGPTRMELTNQAISIVGLVFDNGVLELCQTPPLEHADFSPNQVTKLMSNLLSDVPQEAPVLDATQRQALIAAAQARLGKEAMGPILHRVFVKLRFVTFRPCSFVCLTFGTGSLPPNTSLVQVLIQLGPDITNDSEAVRGLLERFGITAASPPRDSQITEVISALARLAAEGTVICDVGSLVRAFASYVCLQNVTVIPFYSFYSHYLFLSACQLKLAQHHQIFRLE
jgi:CCR4-NOT transcription complex subunit 1